MTDGSTGPVAGDSQLAAGNTSAFLHESYQAKRFIHGIHGGAKRVTPFTHCMNVGGSYNTDGTNKVAGGPSLGYRDLRQSVPGRDRQLHAPKWPTRPNWLSAATAT